MTKHVAVLMGGWSAEREVSLVSGAAVVKALKKMGIRVSAIDIQRDLGALLTRLYPKPDVVFNALHGPFGEDGCVQGLLDILAIPYTHSGVLASSLAMNKVMAKKVFALAGIKTANQAIISTEADIKADFFPRPYVLKPVNEGSSVGVYIVREGDNFPRLDGFGQQFGKKMMVEAFIDGCELTVSVMGDRPLAVTEIVTKQEFYDYDAKYKKNNSQHIIPATLDKKVYDEALSLAKLAHDSIGCRGVSRADFRYDGKDLFILEINTQPGLTPTSLVPEQAAYAGISFEDLVIWMIENAECGP